MQEEKREFKVSLAYNPHTDKFFIDFSDYRGVVISVVVGQKIAEGLSRSLELKIMES